ncbi:hypothetical protein CN611_32555, partial [Bacillus wiedmannii]
YATRVTECGRSIGVAYAFRVNIVSSYQTGIILAGIRALLNLYAKKFRCPDVLTSILAAINL